ncbi:MAG: hypothetical protein K2K82_06315 [Muribaculaceae bacterium]|nr:hypothetical protein [Muribaculaceae bacterium]
MAEKVHDIYSSIISKVNILLERQAMLEQALAQAKHDLKLAADENSKLRKENEALKADLEYMTVARTLATDPQQVADTRQMISGLVREIDRCIAELNAC